MKVDLNALVSELELSSEEALRFLNLETGEVVTFRREEMAIAEEAEADEDFSDFTEWERETLRMAMDVLLNPEVYIQLPILTSQEEAGLMTRFIAMIESPQQQKRLTEAVHSREGSKKFREEILHFGIEACWFDFRTAQLTENVKDWCERHHIAYEA